MGTESTAINHFPYDMDTLEQFKDSQAFPKMVTINTTYICNSKCPHCPYTNSTIRQEQRAIETPYMPEDVFKTIARQTGQNKSILRVSGAGEPLLHNRLIDYIEYAKAEGCQTGLITNGSMMTEDKASRLLSAGIDTIEFSVDAADIETYSIVRKGLDFDNTLENIKLTVALRNTLNPATNIIASVVNQKIITEKVPQIVEFWDKIVDKVQVRKYLTWDINDLADSGDLTPYLNADAPCPFPFDRILIDTNGDVRFCIYDIKGRTNWGNVMKEPISAIWGGADFQWLRQLHIKREFSRMKLCENCADRQFRSWNYNYYYLLEKASKEKLQKQPSKDET
ncbi:radical SAM/SPASM domain-containing protein [Candidatus Magnetominusculus xianensis]|uniref:Radical SAM protein n=1 Tax=Candidatus Magnetominusculus xianensis TaxID=1748249 RepID=A0ABR5SGG5_9BACT|nr:radical SAM/SPASM domain-containing protein [Candidatus Magnetominusculus xianensis]KWT85309.1 radical SAM protein [Candidatus Magnetominusculus xianensis]MBF0404820.1 radical SAM protein [Nitrospirota bacterium]